MLILTRRIGESLMIGDNATVTVLRVSGNQVRLGIAAPARVPVHRMEIHKAAGPKGAAPARPGADGAP